MSLCKGFYQKVYRKIFVGVHTIHIEKAIKAINSLSDKFEAQQKNQWCYQRTKRLKMRHLKSARLSSNINFKYNCNKCLNPQPFQKLNNTSRMFKCLSWNCCYTAQRYELIAQSRLPVHTFTRLQPQNSFYCGKQCGLLRKRRYYVASIKRLMSKFIPLTKL